MVSFFLACDWWPTLCCDFPADVDANFFEQWITTLRAAIGYKPELSTVDFLVTQPGNHRAYRVVSVPHFCLVSST
jgi:hypothetical protein